MVPEIPVVDVLLGDCGNAFRHLRGRHRGVAPSVDEGVCRTDE